MTVGKKTMNTLFKSSGDVSKLKDSLEVMERDVQAHSKLLDIMSIYLSRVVLPRFKHEKLALYSNVLKQMCVTDISNAHEMASFWSRMLRDPNVSSSNGNPMSI